MRLVATVLGITGLKKQLKIWMEAMEQTSCRFSPLHLWQKPLWLTEAVPSE